MADKELEINENDNVEESVVEEETTVETVVEEETTETEAVESDQSEELEEMDHADKKKKMMKAGYNKEDGHKDDDEDEKEMNATYKKKMNASYGSKKEYGNKMAMKKKVSKEDIDVAQHIDAMLNGQDLSEEFKEKAQTIFEAAVLEKINEEVEKLETQYEETLEENLVEIRTEISEKVDEYLTYVAKEWLEDNLSLIHI